MIQVSKNLCADYVKNGFNVMFSACTNNLQRAEEEEGDLGSSQLPTPCLFCVPSSVKSKRVGFSDGSASSQTSQDYGSNQKVCTITVADVKNV